MRTMNLRDANQQFSKLVREIEETGETIIVLRNGKPAITLSAVPQAVPFEEQEAAKHRLMDPGRAFTFPDDWTFKRDEVADALSRRPTRQVNEGDLDMQLVEQVERTGEPVEILRDGKPMAELRPSPQNNAFRGLTPEKEAALKSMLETARLHGRKSDGRKMTRDEMHER